jgi:hypothetical protein
MQIPGPAPYFLSIFLQLAYSFALKMEAAGFSKMLVSISHTTLHHIPEDIVIAFGTSDFR